MRHVTIRWVCYFAAMLVIGPLAGALVAGLRAADGGRHATALVTASPMKGLASTFAAFALASLAGLGTSLIASARAGLTAAGLVLVWAAWRSAEVESIIRTTQSASPLWALAFEGAIWMTLAGVAALAIEHFGHPEHGHTPENSRKQDHTRVFTLLNLSPPALVASVAVGAAAAWFIAAQGLKGQTVAAGIGAGLAAATAARLIDRRVHAPALFVPGVVLAIAGPLAGVFLSGGGIVEVTYAGALAPIARVAPLDWAAGWLLGVPIGLGWAASMGADRRNAQARAA